MFVRSVLSSYSRLLVGISLAAMAVALAGCNDSVAQKAEAARPVLGATAHYGAESPERRFVGTLQPRVAADIGLLVPRHCPKRLVDVGQTRDVCEPLATP